MNRFKGKPLLVDYLKRRENKLVIDIYHGSVDVPHPCLLDTDAVIGIELIEHLYPETSINLPYNIFGFMKPKLIILTTPNYEFNILFKTQKMENNFRHDDHKFEWTRQQFQDWSLNICLQYNDYRVAFYEIGPGPPNEAHLGCVSQMAVFVRKDFLLEKLGISDDQCSTMCNENTQQQQTPTLNPFKSPLPPLINLLEYEKIFTHTYPILVDSRSREEKLLNECQFHIGRMQNMDEEYFNCERYLYLIPIKDVYKYVDKETDNIREIRAILLKNNYIINQDDLLEIQPEDSDDDDYDDGFEDSMDKMEVNAVVNKSEEDWCD